MSYQGYEGWFKEHVTSLSVGRYWLSEESAVTLGEPVCWSSVTGLIANPKRKRRIKAYNNATAGADMSIGVSLDVRYASSGVDDEDKVLRPDRYYPREIAVMKIGVCPIKNTNTGMAISLNDTVLPTINGCETINNTATGLWDARYTLGKSLTEIAASGRGLIWVNPESFEKNAQ